MVLPTIKCAALLRGEVGEGGWSEEQRSESRIGLQVTCLTLSGVMRFIDVEVVASAELKLFGFQGREYSQRFGESDVKQLRGRHRASPECH